MHHIILSPSYVTVIQKRMAFAHISYRLLGIELADHEIRHPLFPADNIPHPGFAKCPAGPVCICTIAACLAGHSKRSSAATDQALHTECTGLEYNDHSWNRHAFFRTGGHTGIYDAHLGRSGRIHPLPRQIKPDGMVRRDMCRSRCTAFVIRRIFQYCGKAAWHHPRFDRSVQLGLWYG